ncbi:helix-turn-helix domain-containing protein [Anaerosinus sp.]|uniref:helix-turn-helix domain-containing protein n=1 Tax=Selenobaculum sp. TaxID=3074374 RepID=UPI003AB404D1
MVGDILRAERERRGLAIRDVEEATSIRALYIQSIEENKYDIIPGEVYLKGFIKTYANFLNLDGNAVVNQYRQEKTPPNVILDDVESNVVENKGLKPQNNNKIEFGNIIKQKIVIGGLAFALVCGYWMLNLDSSEAPMEQPKQEVKTVVAVPKEVSVPVTAPQSKPIKISLKFEGACWTEVKVDNHNIYEGIPNPGEVLTWDANNDIIIKLGNAGVVDVTHNGNVIGKLGAVGDVIEKKFIKGQS